MALNIDYIAQNNRLRDVNSNLKIIISIGIMLIALFITNIPLEILIIIGMAIGILGIARIKLSSYLKFMAIPFSFTALTCIFLLFFFGSGKVIWDSGISIWIFHIVIRQDSLNTATLVFFRVFACVSCLGFMSLTTPINDFLHALAKIHVPKELIELAMLMYNIIFIFLDEVETMKNAQKSRLGFRGYFDSFKSLASIISNLFLKSLDKAEMLQKALESRGYQGDIPIYEPSKKKEG